MITRKDRRRPLLFSTLFVVGLVNALSPELIAQWDSSKSVGHTVAAALSLSVVPYAATAIGIRLLNTGPQRPVDRSDLFAALVFTAMVLTPHRAVSWLAITLLALFLLVRDVRSTGSVAAGSLFLAIAFADFWSKVLALTFATTLLAWDGRMVAGILDYLMAAPVVRNGNAVRIGDQTIVIILGCDSLTNAAWGLLWWMTVARLLSPAWQRSDLVLALFVPGLVVILNAFRVAGMGTGPMAYQWLHEGMGSHVYNVTLLFLIAMAAVGACLWADPTRGRGPVAVDRG